MLDFYPPTLADKDLFPKHSRYLAYNYYYSYVHLWSEQIAITIAKNETALYMHLRDDDCFLLPITDDLPKAMSELKTQRPNGLAFSWRRAGNRSPQAPGARVFDSTYPTLTITSMNHRNDEAFRAQAQAKETTSPVRAIHLRSVLFKPEMREECYEMASTRWLEDTAKSTKHHQ